MDRDVSLTPSLISNFSSTTSHFSKVSSVIFWPGEVKISNSFFILPTFSISIKKKRHHVIQQERGYRVFIPPFPIRDIIFLRGSM